MSVRTIQRKIYVEKLSCFNVIFLYTHKILYNVTY